MAVTLLRHPPPDIAQGVCYGATDLALAPGWEAQATLLSATLPAAGLVISSPLSRCRKLAGFIAKARDLPLQVDPRWREMNFGVWEGVAWDDIPRHALDAWADHFHSYADHGGESVGVLESRVRAGLSAAPDGALIVTHAGCIKAAHAIHDVAAGWDTRVGFGEWVRLDR